MISHLCASSEPCSPMPRWSHHILFDSISEEQNCSWGVCTAQRRKIKAIPEVTDHSWPRLVRHTLLVSRHWHSMAWMLGLPNS